MQSKRGASTYAVFVVTKDGKNDVAKLHPVELGQVVGNSVIVNSGLESGSRIVVTGATIVRDGDTVRPVQ